MNSPVTYLFAPPLASEEAITPDDVVATDESHRALAASEAALTLAALEVLARDDSAWVRQCLAANPLVAHSHEAMRLLANDAEISVRDALRRNRVVPAAYSNPAYRSHPARFTGVAAAR